MSVSVSGKRRTGVDPQACRPFHRSSWTLPPAPRRQTATAAPCASCWVVRVQQHSIDAFDRVPIQFTPNFQLAQALLLSVSLNMHSVYMKWESFPLYAPDTRAAKGAAEDRGGHRDTLGFGVPPPRPRGMHCLGPLCGHHTHRAALNQNDGQRAIHAPMPSNGCPTQAAVV